MWSLEQAYPLLELLSPSIMTAAISPLFTVFLLSDIDNIPVKDTGVYHGIPLQVRAKSAQILFGRFTYSSMFSLPKWEVPQAIEPMSGIFFISGMGVMLSDKEDSSHPMR